LKEQDAHVEGSMIIFSSLTANLVLITVDETLEEYMLYKLKPIEDEKKGFG
jgi:hypothetical protein